MSNSRETVLGRVRQALGRPPESKISERPPGMSPRQAGDVESELDLFVNEINLLSGNAQRLTEDRLDGALQALIQAEDIKIAAAWQTPGLKTLRLEERLKGFGVEILPANTDKHGLAACDLGVTEADYALPETGTLGLLSSAEKPRMISLVPRVHLAVVSPSALRSDLHDLFALAKEHPYLICITGPSRTSDIELTVTLGVHGPKKLYVFVMG